MVNIFVEDNRLMVRSPFAAKDAVKGGGGSGARWSKERRVWTFPATPAMARALAERLRATTFDVEWDMASRILLDDDARATTAQLLKFNDAVLAPIPRVKTPPWRHQLAAYHFMQSVPMCILTMGMGTGKTKVAIDAIINSDDRRVLVVCPRYVVSVWARQVELHASAPIEVVLLGDGTTTKRAENLRYIHGARGDTLVMFVVNYEALDRGALRVEIEKIRWDRIILDEGHRIKDPGGSRSRFLSRLGMSATRRAILTGTPTDNPMDWYALFRFIDPGVLGTSFTVFRAHYAMLDPKYNRPLKFIHQEELQSKIGRYIFHVGDDVIELPEARNETIPIVLSKVERDLYDQMESEMVAEMLDGRITAANAAVKLLRLQQITGGIAPMEDGRNVRISTSKVDALSDLLSDIGHDPIVVFCRFLLDIDAALGACAAAKIPCAELSGRTTDAGVLAWQRGEGQALVVQIDAGALGIDLTRAHIGIYYSMGFSNISYAQSRKRLHRPGQQHGVIYYHLIATGTVDSYIMRVIVRKGATERAFLEAVMEGMIKKKLN